LAPGSSDPDNSAGPDPHSRPVATRAKETFRRARDASSIANAALAENINGVRTVQQARREDVNFGAYETKARHNLLAQIEQLGPPDHGSNGRHPDRPGPGRGHRRWRMGGRIRPAWHWSHDCVHFLCAEVLDPIRTLSQQYTVMQRAMAAGYRIFEVLDIR